MQLDIKRAFLSPFSEKDWPWNLFLFGVLSYITIAIHANMLLKGALIGIPFSILIRVLLFGYLIHYIHNEIHGITPSLPNWKTNIFSYFKKGLECSIIILGYVAIYLIILFIPILLICLIPLSWVKLLFITLLFIVSLPILGIIVCCYADTLNYSDSFNLKRSYKLFSKAKKEMIFSSFLAFTLIIFADIFTFFTISNIIAVSILTPIILIISNLCTQGYKISKFEFNKDINRIKSVSNSPKGLFYGCITFLVPSTLLIIGITYLLLIASGWTPFLANGPSFGKRTLICPATNSYIQEMQFCNGLKLRVYKGNKEQGPIVSLVDNLGKVKWCTYDAFAEEITFTNYTYLPILGLRVKGDAIWGNGRADTYWYIDNKGNLKEYWFEGGAFVN